MLNSGKGKDGKANRITDKAGSDKKGKKTNLTLSVSDQIFKQLRIDCDSEDTSINQKVNSILIRWLFCYRAIGLSGGIVIHQQTWMDIINNMDEEFLVESLEHSARVTPAILSQNDIALTVNNLIENIFYKTALYAGNYSHFHHYTDDSDNVSLIFEHSYGLKWSRILGKSICRFFNNQFGLATDLQTIKKHQDNCTYLNCRPKTRTLGLLKAGFVDDANPWARPDVRLPC